jgi:transposase-like protein
MSAPPNSLTAAVRYFSDLSVCNAYMRRIKWPDGKIICPQCRSERIGEIATRSMLRCKDCRKQFSYKLGTIFEDSPLGLDKWFVALWANGKDNVSGAELGRTLGVTQKTGWLMQRRIREKPDSATLLHALIDADIGLGMVDADQGYEAEEWQGKLVQHFRRERDRHIVELKKADAFRCCGKLQCEVCDFVFTDLYGALGEGFIECHHTKQLATIQEGERTRLEDLAIVCANCHRILHKSTTTLTVAKLRKIVERHRCRARMHGVS